MCVLNVKLDCDELLPQDASTGDLVVESGKSYKTRTAPKQCAAEAEL